MAGICTDHFRKNGPTCDHRLVTVVLDGETFQIETEEAAIDESPWTRVEQELFIRLGLKRLRTLGLPLDNIIGRVTNGEEATNVKQYNFLGPGGAVTKTNIGTAYVNVCPGANGERVLVDCTGCTQFRLVLTANLVGTGPWNVRVIRDSDSTVLYESPNITQSGERELDTDWQTLPAWAAGLEVLRLQAKSAVAADDPIFRRLVLLVK
jgi:hypothetical protein